MALNTFSCFATTLGVVDAPQTGVIAQDVQRILPDAVSNSKGAAQGRRMLLVDKERIFLGDNDAIRVPDHSFFFFLQSLSLSLSVRIQKTLAQFAS